MKSVLIWPNCCRPPESKTEGSFAHCQFTKWDLSPTRDADIKEYGHLIISVVDFCSLLRKDGKIESHIHDRAVAFLHSQNQAEYASSTESVLDGPVYVDDLALYYLQSAGALKPACSCGLDIRIHPHVLESKDILIRGRRRWQLSLKRD